MIFQERIAGGTGWVARKHKKGLKPLQPVEGAGLISKLA
jgi:hypothetical protein